MTNHEYVNRTDYWNYCSRTVAVLLLYPPSGHQSIAQTRGYAKGTKMAYLGETGEQTGLIPQMNIPFRIAL